MKYPIEIVPYGEKAILITWPEKIEVEISEELLAVKQYLNKEYATQLNDISVGYQSLLLCFTRMVTPKLVSDVYLKMNQVNWRKHVIDIKTWNIPVCYDFDVALDLEKIVKHKKITLDKFITLHTAPTYHIYGKGFLPGFLYLGGLDTQLHTARKTTPNLKIPKNSVAIGGQQTGIYPSESPGGWHIVGRTPISFFDIKESPPSSIKIGDKLNFYAISKKEFVNYKPENIKGIDF